MGATLIVGAQFGGEGKGKVTALESALCERPWVVRCGGPNSGHSTRVDGVETILRQVPAAAGHPNAMLLLSAGSAIDESVLLEELARCRIPRERIVIDPRAVLISRVDRENETSIRKSIGSTASGTGSALIRRMTRAVDVALAKDSAKLRDRARIEAVAPLLHEQLEKGADIIVEGTQGFGLSLLHSPYYPHVTARDTTASAFAAEVGLSPRSVASIVLVLRTFPIRVAGNSGPLPNELQWDDLRKVSGATLVEEEFTSVTKTLRRVGGFDIDLVKAARQYNSPTNLAVMGLDRLDIRNRSAHSMQELTPKARQFLVTLEQDLRTPIRWVGTGFGTVDAFHRSASGSEVEHV